MSLRFAMVTTFYPPFNFGGDGIGIERFCHALLRRGHHVTVIHDEDAWRNLAPGREPPPKAHPPGLEVVRLRSRHGLLSNLLTQQIGRPVVHGRRIAQLLRDGRFDVINFHNVSLVGGPGILKHGDALKLHMAHEHWLVCPSHVLWRHNKELCTGRECLKCVLSYKRPPQLWRATGYLERELRHVDAFIAMSEFSRAKHREFGFPRDMEVVNYFLPDPPSGQSAPPTPEGAPPHPRPYVLFVGRLEKIKGLDDVIPLFRERITDCDLVIAGDGDYAAPLKQLSAGCERVRFLGRVPLEQLASWYRHAQALVVPSVCFETFGIILIEAFQQGTPVLARRLGPFPEIVEKARAGELFTTADELVAGLARLRDPARRAELGANGWRAYVDHWSEAAVVPKYLDVIRRAALATGRSELAARVAAAGAEAIR
ncbi:MAG: glycosyltransferase family 4 protein [Planctomycetes bacterium]|nr:glycosyltransferase family 4 protein [Planctomycetota bacterium]